MQLDDANVFEALAGFGRKEMSSKEKIEGKFRYIEAIIRFLNLYCQNELGSGEASIEKVCMWVNSPWFENNELYRYKTQDDIYKELEEQIIHNVPLYRLLNISGHLLKILEEDHTAVLQQKMMEQAQKYPCLKCIWYKAETTSLGHSSVCDKPKDFGEMYRRGYLDITSVTKCDFCTTLTETGKPIQELKKRYDEGKLHSGHYHNARASIENMDRLKERWQTAFEQLDNSEIPKVFEQFDLRKIRKELKSEDSLLHNLGRAFQNKQPLSEIAENLQNAMLVKAMITFIEIYAQSELGSDYVADIIAIAKYVYTSKHEIPEMFCEEDVYRWLEQKILYGEDITKFCRSIYKESFCC